MEYPERQFEVQVGDDTWVIVTHQNSTGRRTNVTLTIAEQSMDEDTLRQKFEQATQLKDAFMGIHNPMGIRKPIILNDTVIHPRNVVREPGVIKIEIAGPFPSSEEYASNLLAALQSNALNPKEVPYIRQRAEAITR